VLGLADARPAVLERHAAPDRDVARLVTEISGLVAAAAAGGAGGVIALRRLAGAFEPAGGAAIGAAVVVGVALVLAADAAWRRAPGQSLLPPLAARGGLLLAVAALAWPPTAAGWPTVVVATVAAGAAVAALPRGGASRSRAGLPLSRWRERPPAAGPRRRDPAPGRLRQRFERRELDAGIERVRGRIVVAVPAGSKTGFGHLGFCPAFVTTPTVQVSTAYDGVEVVVSAAEVLPWGVRVECRLAEPAEEPVEIPVDLVAEAPA
jgi:hypothetical protein